MSDVLWLILPEIWLFVAAVVIVVLGLSPQRQIRHSLSLLTGIALVIAAVLVALVYGGERGQALLQGGEVGGLMPTIGAPVKMVVCIVGVALCMLSSGLIDRRYEAAVDGGRATFDPIRANRGEFYAFFLLSLIGVMLCCNARDLVWLFLALELTSLPTYVMVAISRGSRRAQEAAVKYFFLGALAAAFFLFGFALLYGETGSIVLTDMRAAVENNGELGQIGTVGMLMAILGIGFKMAAFPMQFYAADVYEGAASPVTAFLGFVPKTAGVVALMLLLGIVGWDGTAESPGLPGVILTLLWMMAVLTMTLGNIGALLQRSVKRMLAYSSIAHSGYMLIGVIAGPAYGINAVIFYLLAYGLMNTGAFAVLAGLERRGHEIESMDDLAGLRHRHPMMSVVMAVTAGSLLGVPPLLGFVAKLGLFVAGVEAGQIALVVIAGLNSAISAWYYLQLVGLPILYKPTAQSETIVSGPTMWPRVAGVVLAAALVILPVFGADALIRSMSSANDAADGDAAVEPERAADDREQVPYQEPEQVTSAS
ncbi:MAG: NADH-quinone oxidoreductase subunit N [Planctomycetota bacterium]